MGSYPSKVFIILEMGTLKRGSGSALTASKRYLGKLVQMAMIKPIL
jgi:hypothetical protein